MNLALRCYLEQWSEYESAYIRSNSFTPGFRRFTCINCLYLFSFSRMVKALMSTLKKHRFLRMQTTSSFCTYHPTTRLQKIAQYGSILRELIQITKLSKGRNIGCAIAQAVSRWLPTAAAQVPAWVWQVGFVVDKVVLGQVFSEYFGFPCQSSFHLILHHHNHPGQVQ
jgi:hypothetical protein